MSRIFPPLAIVAVVLMLIAFGLGWVIDDAGSPDPEQQKWVRWHFFTSLGGLVFVCLVHSIVLTYFMGTGRWLEETSKAYSLGDEYFAAGKKIKYRTIPLMVVGIVLLVLTGAFGAIADPAARSSFDGLLGLTPARVHFAVASFAITVNVLVHLLEHQAVRQNGQIIDRVLADVRRIRTERGLPTEPAMEHAETQA